MKEVTRGIAENLKITPPAPEAGQPPRDQTGVPGKEQGKQHSAGGNDARPRALIPFPLPTQEQTDRARLDGVRSRLHEEQARKTTAGEHGKHDRQESQTASSGATQEHTYTPTLEEMHSWLEERQRREWTAKHPQTWEDVVEMAAITHRISEKINKLREAAGTPEETKELTWWEFLLQFLGMILAIPLTAVEETLKETQQQNANSG